jgi:hypothetical protein
MLSLPSTNSEILRYKVWVTDNAEARQIGTPEALEQIKKALFKPDIGQTLKIK